MIDLLLALALARIEPLTVRIEPLTARIENEVTQVTTVRRPEATVLEVSADVLFALDSSMVRRRAAAPLAAVRHQVGDRCPLIVGHTDDRGTDAYNLVLSRRRARAVREALGTDCARVVGRGEREPVRSNETAGGRARNRRVEVALADHMG